MAKRRGITAEELMRQLEADPKWVADNAAREARRAAREARFRAEEAPIVAGRIDPPVTYHTLTTPG